MDDEKKVVDQTAQTATTEQTATEGQGAAASNVVDYEALLKDALDGQERERVEKENYKQGLLKAKKDKVEGEEGSAVTIDPEAIDKIVDEAVAKRLNTFQSTIASTTIDNLISSYTSDPAKQKLIKFNWEKKVLKEGDLASQVENAVAITDRQAILKTNRELGVALTNRQQLANASVGTHTEGQKVKDNIFDEKQLADLRARGFDDKKIELLKKNLARNRS